MEPVTFSLVMAWLLLRYGVGDAVAAWRGSESPRTVDRAARQNIDRERRAAGLGPTVGQAVRGRLAQRIANPPPRPDREPGPFRTWLAEWWDDAWAGATERRIARREARHADMQRREREEARRRQLEDELWPRRQRRNPDPEPEPDDDDEVIDAEVVDPDAPPAPEPEPEPVNLDKPSPPDPTPPDPTPDTAPKESPVTTNIDINGETIDPTSASAFANNCKAVAEQLLIAIEQSIATLEERKVTGAPLEHFEQMRENFTLAMQSADAADVYFQSHINTQDQIGSDDTIAGTVEGTYLDKAAS